MDSRDIAVLAFPPPPAGTAEHARDARAFYAATDLEGPRQLTLGLVHEMNNLLGGIAVLSEIYQDRSVADDGLAEGLGLIHKSTGRLQTLIRHLKTINTPPTGESVYLNLAESVRGMFEMFAPMLPKTLAVVMAFPVEEMAVHLDEALLRRVLLNLTLNLRDGLRHGSQADHKLHVGGRLQPGDKVALTLSMGGDEAPSVDARARLADARQGLCKLGGTLIAHTPGEYILELPLVI